MKEITFKANEFKPQDECGVFALYSNKSYDISRMVYYGLFALQHRGQESCGIAVSHDGNKINYYKNMGLVSEVFTEENISKLPKGNIALGHVRYSSSGLNNIINAQPIVFSAKMGRMAIAYNGNITNVIKLKEKLIDDGVIFQTTTFSEVIVALVNKYVQNGNLIDGIVKACNELEGGFSIVFITADKVIAVRDKLGTRPLCLGNAAGGYVVSSESCAIDAIDGELIRSVGAGEVLVIDNKGIKSYWLDNINQKSCIFEYVYIARPDSVIDDVGVYASRQDAGKYLAQLFHVDADIVAAVPDSALVAAKGYADESGIPFGDALIKNRYIGRTFIQPNQLMRENSVKIKLNACKVNIAGKRVILVDDSIVRGTTCKKIIELLRNQGAKEVHVMIASPIVKCPCFYGIDIETKDQLVGANYSEDEICKILGADSLHYLPLEYLKKACGGEDNKCCACFDGQYYQNLDAQIKYKLDFE